MESFALGLNASLLAGAATFVGALPILLTHRLNQRTMTTLLGFGGGVMLAATAFSLIIPGTEAAIAQNYPKLGAATIMAAGIGIGSLFLSLAHRFFPTNIFLKDKKGRTPPILPAFGYLFSPLPYIISPKD